MTPERARKIAQECADLWYGGAAGLNLKEAIAQGIFEACQETEGDLVATRAERDTYRRDLADARAQRDVAVQTVGKLQTERDAWRERAIGAELERDQYRHELDACRDAMAQMNAPAIALAALQPPPPIIMPKSDFDWIRENDHLHQRIDRLEAIRTAASVLICEAEEWECDGLGLFAQHGYWDALHEAMERADEADAMGKEPVDDVRERVADTK